MNIDGWVKIIGAVAALIAGGFALRFFIKAKQKNVTRVTQKDLKVGGDNAGRDINK